MERRRGPELTAGRESAAGAAVTSDVGTSVLDTMG